MFQYNPTVNNISGQIYGEGLERAAAYNADAIRTQGEADLMRAQRVHQGIIDGAGLVGKAAKAAAGFMAGGPAGAAMAMGGGGGGGEGGGGSGGGLFDTIITAYAKKEQDKSDSKIYGNLMKIVAPAFGKDGDSLLEQWNSLESDSDRASFGSSLLGSLGTISNMYMAKGRMGMQQQGQQIQQNAPMARAAATNAATVAQRGNMVPGARFQRSTP